MSITIAWPDSEEMPGMCILLEDIQYWIRPTSDKTGDRLDKKTSSKSTITNHTLVMDDDELSDLLFAYARRKGVIK